MSTTLAQHGSHLFAAKLVLFNFKNTAIVNLSNERLAAHVNELLKDFEDAEDLISFIPKRHGTS